MAEKGEEMPKTEVKAEEGQNEANGDGSVSNGEEFTPIGKGVFGNIYDQFKGKVKEAFAFLKKIGVGKLWLYCIIGMLVILLLFGIMKRLVL